MYSQYILVLLFYPPPPNGLLCPVGEARNIAFQIVFLKNPLATTLKKYNVKIVCVWVTLDLDCWHTRFYTSAQCSAESASVMFMNASYIKQQSDGGT